MSEVCRKMYGRDIVIPPNGVTGSVLGNALTGAGKLLKKRSLVFIFSDFRSGEWEKPLISLAQKNDVVAMRLMDKFDESLPSMGSVPFEDCESDLTMVLPTSSEKFKKEWRLQNESRVRNWQELCAKHGIMPVLLNTTDEPLQVLSSVFNQKNTNK